MKPGLPRGFEAWPRLSWDLETRERRMPIILRISRNEAVPSSRDATARALTFPSLGGQDRSRPPWGRLHGFRSVTMINTLQLTRTTRLYLALSGRRGGKPAILHRSQGTPEVAFPATGHLVDGSSD